MIIRQAIDYTSAMKAAYQAAWHSPDPSTQNGAVLLGLQNEIIGTGCNDFPQGVDKAHWTGTDKAPKYARVCHAEVAAILQASRLGRSTLNSTLVCPWAACSNCAKYVCEAGVRRLVRHNWSNSGVTTGSHWYDDCIIGDEILREGGVMIVEIDPVKSLMKLRRDGKEWTSPA